MYDTSGINCFHFKSIKFYILLLLEVIAFWLGQMMCSGLVLDYSSLWVQPSSTSEGAWNSCESWVIWWANKFLLTEPGGWTSRLWARMEGKSRIMKKVTPRTSLPFPSPPGSERRVWKEHENGTFTRFCQTVALPTALPNKGWTPIRAGEATV